MFSVNDISLGSVSKTTIAFPPKLASIKMKDNIYGTQSFLSGIKVVAAVTVRSSIRTGSSLPDP